MPTRKLGALECRAGGRRCGELLRAITEHDFGIGADIDEQLHCISAMRTFGKDRRCRVGTHVPRNTGAHVVHRTRGLEADVACSPVCGFVGSQDERRRTKWRRVDAKKDVVHDRVAHHGDLEHARNVDVCLFHEIIHQRIDRLTNDAREFGIPTRVHHHVRHSTHQIFAEANLWIHRPRTGQHLARKQLDQVTGDGGAADVDGNAVRGVNETGPHGHDLVCIHRNSHSGAAISFFDRLVHSLQCCRMHRGPRSSMLRSNRSTDLFFGGDSIAELRLLHLHVQQREVRIDDHATKIDVLAHHLAMHLARGRYVDDDITAHLGHTAEPVALLEFSLSAVLDLPFAARRERVARGLDVPLREVADARRDLATSTYASSTAHRVEVDTKTTSSVENGDALLDGAVETGWCEDDAWHGASVSRLTNRGATERDDGVDGPRDRRLHPSGRWGHDWHESRPCSPCRYR